MKNLEREMRMWFKIQRDSFIYPSIQLKIIPNFIKRRIAKLKQDKKFISVFIIKSINI